MVAMVLFSVIASGCIGGSPVTSTESYPSDTFSSTIPTPATHAANVPADAIKVYVVKVIDGDTIDVAFSNGTVERVRFLGVDTPETSASRNKADEYDHITDLECLASWGVAAKFFVRDSIQDRVVYIEFDPIAGKRGYYGRLLAYVYLKNGTDFTALLVKKGYARVYTEGKFRKEGKYVSYQKTAESRKLGLWGCEVGRYANENGAATNVASTGDVVIVKVHYDAGGPHVRDTEQLNDEYVVLENRDSTTVNLKGWLIMDKADHRYYFPSVTLQPGKRIVLHTGKGTNTAHDLYWGSGRAIWNNDHDTAYLYNSQGELVDEFSW
ncbi:lamin tail domain-containing protein [Thermococcus siculi]|nr:lamin tail domain-containing protein [Thermococcus siculi]